MPELTKMPPPYMSYGVFKSTADNLAEATVPTGALDRRVLHWLSGADHGALMSGLKFLGYVDDERRATNTYRQLVEASRDTEQFKSKLLEVLNSKYEPIIGDLNLQSGTIAELEKAFKSYGVPPGQMLTKTIRFYLKALNECGVQVSTHITKAKPRAPRITRFGKNGKHPPPPPPNFRPHIVDGEVPHGFERMPVPGVPHAFIQYPMDLTEAQCGLLDAVTVMLRAYAKTHSGGKERKP